MRFINPKTDFAFKKIFGSAESQDILLSFLNALLDLKPSYRIQEVTLTDPYLAPKIKGMKETYLDIRAKDEQGKSYIIEMQVLNVPALEKRILYNACKSYANQLTTGERYHLLTDVIAITITDFTMFTELTGIVNTFKLRAEQGHVYCDDLELVFAELSKFNKTEDELGDVLERWFYFLKHASDLSAVPEALAKEPAIAHAFEIANRANLSVEELDAQERREMFIQDQRGSIELAEAKGIEQGKEQGREEGRKEGRKEGRELGDRKARLDIAKSLLEILDNETIAEKTGLSIDEVKRHRFESS